jgi:hypothetical protein
MTAGDCQDENCPVRCASAGGDVGRRRERPREFHGLAGPEIAKGSDQRTLCIFFSPCRTGRLSGPDAMSVRTHASTANLRRLHILRKDADPRDAATPKKGRTPGRSAASRQGGSQSRDTQGPGTTRETGAERLRLYVRARRLAEPRRGQEAGNGRRNLHRRRGGELRDPSASSAEIRQPPRADRGRHRHRQDRDAADPRRELFGQRRAGDPVGREGRSFGAGAAAAPDSSCTAPSPNAPRRSASPTTPTAPSR